MKAFKEKQFLIFKFPNGKQVSYNLETKETIGLRGKPVKTLQSQLSGYSISEIIDSFDDENYRCFLRFAKNRSEYGIANAGTMLEYAKRYSRFEQFFSAGIKHLHTDLKFNVTDIPKPLLNLCRKYGWTLSNKLYDSYKKMTDIYSVAFQEDYISLDSGDLQTLFNYDVYLTGRYNRDFLFSAICEEYNYNAKSLLRYVDNLRTYEALEGMATILTEIRDYNNMARKISPKYDKYPKNFLTTHKIMCRNYNRLKKQFIEEDFAKQINKSLEWNYKDYCIIYPNTTQDIKDEAVQQNNCVASYIQQVIDGGCHILFLRKKEDKDKGLVTLEIRNNKVVQAKGKYNRDISNKEQVVVNKYNVFLSKKEKENVESK